MAAEAIDAANERVQQTEGEAAIVREQTDKELNEMSRELNEMREALAREKEAREQSTRVASFAEQAASVAGRRLGKREIEEDYKVEQDKIINKIRKVLALTKSNYQEEAQAALLKAQELMAQHGITMSEIEISSKEVDLEKQVVDTCVSESRRNTWYEKNLSSIIGKNFRCHPYVTGGKGIYFIGLKEDVEIAKEIYLYALTTMLYLATNYVKENRNKIIRITSKQLKNDYMIGFLNGLKKRFEEQVESKGYALILAKDALVVQAVEEKNLIKKKGSKIVIAGSLDARQTGYRDGRNFNENKKMIR